MTCMTNATTHWLGPWLRAVRTKDNISAATIGERLGIEAANVLRRERGAVAIGDHELKPTLEAYGVTPERFAAQMRRVP